MLPSILRQCARHVASDAIAAVDMADHSTLTPVERLTWPATDTVVVVMVAAVTEEVGTVEEAEAEAMAEVAVVDAKLCVEHE